ncbi:MAG: YigZ family protein [Pseudobutyrivibrio sp.]|nr:YigZ family protein [Pseudobutyrivibrio sp.]
MSADSYKILYNGGTGEIEEKKSRFIAHIAPVSSEQEAVDFINSKKKEFWDAKHNCAAFVIGEHNELTRCNDDGEPAGTAGRPMLDLLLRENVHNCVVVVTRYFGGVLLGTGGLVRAYQGAVAEGLKNCQIIEPKEGYPAKITCDYNSYGKLEYLLREKEMELLSSDFGADVSLTTVIPEEMKDAFLTAVADRTAGSAKTELSDKVKYALLEGKLLTF